MRACVRVRVSVPACVRLHGYLDLPQRVQELVVAVGEHVQLVPGVPLRLLLGLGEGGLVAGCQLNVDLHVLGGGAGGGRREKEEQESVE